MPTAGTITVWLICGFFAAATVAVTVGSWALAIVAAGGAPGPALREAFRATRQRWWSVPATLAATMLFFVPLVGATVLGIAVVSMSATLRGVA